MQTWCDPAEGCKSRNLTEVPSEWNCTTDKWFDNLCDCGCGVLDPACLAGTAAWNCADDEFCNSDAICQNIAPPEWGCNGHRYNDGLYCDCECGLVDPDCLNAARIRAGCATSRYCNVTSALCIDIPANWTCDPVYYDAGDGCDCGCGAIDPDCATFQETYFCGGTGYRCLASGECTHGPWSCPLSNYDTRDGCHCGCGSQDPDCLVAGQSLVGCTSGQFCDEDGVCQTPPPSSLPESQLSAGVTAIPAIVAILLTIVAL
jgi:hypothetical protein